MEGWKPKFSSARSKSINMQQNRIEILQPPLDILNWEPKKGSTPTSPIEFLFGNNSLTITSGSRRLQSWRRCNERRTDKYLDPVGSVQNMSKNPRVQKGDINPFMKKKNQNLEPFSWRKGLLNLSRDLLRGFLCMKASNDALLGIIVYYLQSKCKRKWNFDSSKAQAQYMQSYNQL